MTRAKQLFYRAVTAVARYVYAGAGSILLFHRVVDAPPARRSGYCRMLETTSAELDTVVHRLRSRGVAIVSMDEALAALGRGGSRGRFAVLSFDDGYADTATRAHPLLSSMGVPFTVYVTTGFVDRLVHPWGIMLESFLSDRDEVRFEVDGHAERLSLVEDRDRDRAFGRILQVLEGKDPVAVRRLGESLFGEDTVRSQDLMLTWDQLASLAADPRVTARIP